MIEKDLIRRIGQDSHWHQSGITHILINAIHWPHKPCSAPWWFDRVGNKPPEKADLGPSIAMCLVFLDSASV